MPFGPISVNSVNFDPRVAGVYSPATVTFGSPRNELMFKPGVLNSKAGLRVGNLYRTVQKDVTVAGVTTRKSLTLHLAISAPSDGSFTPTEVADTLAYWIAALTADRLNRSLLGEI